MSDLWVEAGADAEADLLDRHITTGRVASAAVWPFLAAATSETEYANRKALASDRLDRVAQAVAEGDPVLFSVVRASLEDGFDQDFAVLHGERVAAAAIEATKTLARKEQEAQIRAQAEREVLKRILAGSLSAGDEVTYNGETAVVDEVMDDKVSIRYHNSDDLVTVDASAVKKTAGGLDNLGDKKAEPFGTAVENVDKEQEEETEKTSSRKTAGVSLTKVRLAPGNSIGSNGTTFVGKDSSGKDVTFNVSAKDAASLRSILTSDLAINFSGVTVDESDIVKDASRKTAGIWCKSHDVWVGPGNADTHKGCSKEQKATEQAKESRLTFTAGDKIETDSPPSCDVCKHMEGKDSPAKYDARLPGLGGSWGNVCQRHFDQHGPGQVGTGHAQEYVKKASSKTAASASGWYIFAKSGEVIDGPYESEERARGASTTSEPGARVAWRDRGEVGDDGTDNYKSSARTAGRPRRNYFSLSDAKNEAGEWTMSPEQIAAEMRANSDPEDPDDWYDPYEDDYLHHGSRRHAAFPPPKGGGGGNPFGEKKNPTTNDAGSPDPQNDNPVEGSWKCPSCGSTNAYTQGGVDLDEALKAHQPIQCGDCKQVDQDAGSAPQTPGQAPGQAPPAGHTPPPPHNASKTAAEQGTCPKCGKSGQVVERDGKKQMRGHKDPSSGDWCNDGFPTSVERTSSRHPFGNGYNTGYSVTGTNTFGQYGKNVTVTYANASHPMVTFSTTAAGWTPPEPGVQDDQTDGPHLPPAPQMAAPPETTRPRVIPDAPNTDIADPMPGDPAAPAGAADPTTTPPPPKKAAGLGFTSAAFKTASDAAPLCNKAKMMSDGSHWNCILPKGHDTRASATDAVADHQFAPKSASKTAAPSQKESSAAFTKRAVSEDEAIADARGSGKDGWAAVNHATRLLNIWNVNDDPETYNRIAAAFGFGNNAVGSKENS